MGYDTREPDLFRIVGNVWPKPKDCVTKVPIGALHELPLHHIGLEWRKDQCETVMVKLATKYLEFWSLSLALARLNVVQPSVTAIGPR